MEQSRPAPTPVLSLFLFSYLPIYLKLNPFREESRDKSESSKRITQKARGDFSPEKGFPARETKLGGRERRPASLPHNSSPGLRPAFKSSGACAEAASEPSSSFFFPARYGASPGGEPWRREQQQHQHYQQQQQRRGWRRRQQGRRRARIPSWSSAKPGSPEGGGGSGDHSCNSSGGGGPRTASLFGKGSSATPGHRLGRG